MQRRTAVSKVSKDTKDGLLSYWNEEETCFVLLLVRLGRDTSVVETSAVGPSVNIRLVSLPE